MSKHTPGTWRVEIKGDDHDHPILSDAPGFADLRIGWVRNLMPSSEMIHANARLIAAAPDLLAACEAALPVLEQLPPELVNAASTRALTLVRDAVHELRSEE